MLEFIIAADRKRFVRVLNEKEKLGLFKGK